MRHRNHLIKRTRQEENIRKYTRDRDGNTEQRDTRDTKARLEIQ